MRSRNSGPRSNAWSRSKFTNQTAFEPQVQEAIKAIDFWRPKWEASSGLFVAQMPLHAEFLMPVTIDAVRDAVARLPKEYASSLNAVILLGGSEKQRLATKAFCYGRYFGYWRAIVLHAYPKALLHQGFDKGLKPSVRIDFLRAGAEIVEENSLTIVKFSDLALRDFYLRDVLVHEIGHHVDRPNDGVKSSRKSEGFAEWFASEYGFKPHPRHGVVCDGRRY